MSNAEEKKINIETDDSEEEILEDQEEKAVEETDDEEQENSSSDDPEPTTEPEDELKKIKSENEQLKNRYLRQLAEVENFKKRQQTSMEAFKKFANETIITEMLAVMDNMGRALEHEPKNLDEAKNIINGITMIKESLIDILKRNGLEEIKIENTKTSFDPEIHEAVAVEETDEYDDNVIIEEMQKGYKLNQKIIRHSIVKVAKNSN